MDADKIRFSPAHLASLIKLVDSKVINNNSAKEVFEVMFEEDADPEKYVEEHGMKQENDEGAIKSICQQVIEANPQSVADYKGGKEKAIGFLVGQVMKAAKGKADPGTANKILKELLS